jgi:4-amino-4-deoxy-L-arabinose transferase-like glycosyltransferase
MVNPMKRILESVSSNKATIYIVLLICLILRGGYAWLNRHVPPVEDGALYSALAHHLADGKGYVMVFRANTPLVPTAWGCPLYPLFLSIIYRVSSAPLTIYAVQALVETLTCFLVFRIALLSTKRPLIAVLSALGYAFYLPFIVMACTFCADTFGYLMLAAAIWALVVAEKKGGWYFALSGALMGLAIMVKPALLAFPVFVAIMLFLMRKNRPGFVTGACVFVLASYLIISPWTVRNYLVFHRFVPIATHSGQTLWCGTGPADGKTLDCWSGATEVAGLERVNDPLIPDVSAATHYRLLAFQKQLAGMDEIQRNDALMKAAFEEIRQHPGRYAGLAVKKFFRLWFHLFQDSYRSSKFVLIAAVSFMLMFLAALSYRSFRTERFLFWTTVNLAIYTSLSSMVSYGHIRYSWPVIPFITILAMTGLCNLFGMGPVTKPAVAEEA